MFTNELTPIWKELSKHPVAFFGGLTSGLFRLNLADDPVKSWLEKQSGTPLRSTAGDEADSGPQSIEIE